MKNKQNIKPVIVILLVIFSTTMIAQAKETVKAQGKWTKKEQKVEGTWKIVQDGGVTKLHIYNLKTKKAPDLKFFFSPKTISQSTASNATKGTFFFQKLKSHKGSQSYVLPKGFNLGKYKSILIHCEKYTKLWGGANL